MTAVFIEILNLSIISSFLIVAVLILRAILKKAPKGTRYFLWAMVGLRLCIPYSFESRLSLLPNAQSFDNTVENSTTYISHTEPVVSETVKNSLSIMDILPYVWIGGIAVMLLYMAISYIRIRIQIRESIPYRDNIYICDHISSPFVLGVINPKIYLSSTMSKRDMNLVISHERTHIRHKDNIWKPLGFLILCIYWFNPLCYLAYYLFVKDIELFCDECVAKSLSKTARKKYSYALLGFSKKRVTVTASPLAFAENDVKSRVRNVLSYKKPTLYIIVASVILCVLTMVMFMSSPVSTKLSEPEKDIIVEKVEETVTETVAETEKPTVIETESKKEKPTQKPSEKPTQPAQEYSQQDSYYEESYDYSGSTTYNDTVPFEQSIQNRFEDYEFADPWNQKSDNTPPVDDGIDGYYGLKPYEGEIAWDTDSP